MEFNNYTAMDEQPNQFTPPVPDGQQHLETEDILERAILWEMEKEMKRREIIATEIDWMRRNEFSYVPSSSTVRVEPKTRYPVMQEYSGMAAEQRWHTMPAPRIEPRATTMEKDETPVKKRMAVARHGVGRLKRRSVIVKTE